MNSSAKIFISILALGLAGMGIYFSTLKAIDSFYDDGETSVKKQIPVKPKNIKEKQPLVESGSDDAEEFTFFDTQAGPSMSKFVGLNGSVVEPEEIINKSPAPVDSEVDKKSIPDTPDSAKVLSPVAVEDEPAKVNVEKNVESVASGFALQVGSFRQLERAELLKDKLGKKGYPVFVAMARISGKDEVWYRVFIGRFTEKETAVETARRVKEVEKIDSVMMWQESRP